MWEQGVELIKHWELTPFSLSGWVVAALSLSALYMMHKAREANSRDIREWLREDTEAKKEMAAAYAKVAVSLQRMEAKVDSTEKTLLLSRHVPGGDD